MRLPAVRIGGALAVALAAVAVSVAGPVAAQAPTARAWVEPAEVELGEPFQLVIEVGRVTEAQAPRNAWYWLRQFTEAPGDGPLPFTTEITDPVAGQVGGSVAFTFSLVAKAAGSFELGPFRVRGDGQTLETAPARLQVTLPDPGAVSVRARLDRAEVGVLEEFELIVDVSPADVLLDWPILPDMSDFADYTSRTIRRDAAMVFPHVASSAGTHEIGPVVFKVGQETYRTEPVTLVVSGDAPAIEAHASINTGETWVGGIVMLVIEVPGVRDFDADPVFPDMSGFAERLRNSGGGSSMSDGRFTAHRKYLIRATTAGEFEIGPIQVTAAGQTIRTEPLRLVINETLPPAPVESPRDVLAVALADRKRAYVGEPVTVTYRVLARDSQWGFDGWRVESVDSVALPGSDDFHVRRMGTGGSQGPHFHMDDRPYRVTLQREVAFFPLGAGEPTIGAAEITVQIHQRDLFSSASRGANRPGELVMETSAEQEGTWTPMVLTTDPIPIEVVPLPADGRPESFRGHVGRLEVVSRVDRTHMEVGDTLTLRVEVLRHGLSRPAPDPEIAFPAGFEVLEPEIEDAPRIFGTSGTRVYSYRLVATREGSFRIPPVDMSWFDPESESYETAHTQPFDLTVGETGRDGGGRK
jgi:hypothetical protein